MCVQFEGNDTDDKEKQRKILKRITDAAPVLDVTRAANAAQHSEERQRFEPRSTAKKKKKKSLDTTLSYFNHTLGIFKKIPILLLLRQSRVYCRSKMFGAVTF